MARISGVRPWGAATWRFSKHKNRKSLAMKEKDGMAASPHETWRDEQALPEKKSFGRTLRGEDRGV